jgi:hypothetical protein
MYASGQKYACIPTDVSLTSPAILAASPNAGTTVAGTLAKVRAKCVRGVLKDRKGRKIVFYRTAGCWGNPPADYLQILDRQRKELAALRAKNIVIELPCGGPGLPDRSIP